MSRHETLPFKMTVERGRLIPSTPYDAERLDTWRNGTAVNVTFVRDGGRVMERKWWAVLNRAVKECKTPWKTAAEASEAIKLAIGVVNLTKTVGGDFLAYPKSLTELDDPDLDDAVGQMIDVIYHITGVDPAEWRKQIAHIKEEPQSAAPSADAAVQPPAQTPSTAAPHSAEEAETTEAGEQSSEVKTEDRPVSSPASGLADARECIDKLLGIVTDQALSKQEAASILGESADHWLGRLDPGRKDFVTQVYQTAKKVLKGELTSDKARQYLESIVGAE